ncbi:3-dehydroquinate dehydratase, partial [bacterium CG17_big_fil_post_rev_8_21_14_2_50_64_8]
MKAKRVTMLGGPNLGLLGSREPDVYGTVTWSELETLCNDWASGLGLDLVFAQTDGEGDLVGLIGRAGVDSSGLIINAAAYTHTSVAVRDALSALSIPVIELHLTNPDAREPFRRRNMIR